jgi:two-component system phosphate regulon sensor histidine kinase PhoR
MRISAARDRFGQVRPGDPISFRLRSPALLEALERVIGGDPAQRIEWSEKTPAEQWLEAVIAPVAPTQGSIGGEGDQATPAGPRFILVTIQDQTGQRRLERMRADFVANASHELRTPLASLTGFTETLLGPARDDPVARDKFLQIMMQQGERMRRLIDDLLSLSRVELKAHVQPEATLDLVPLVRHTCDALKPVADEAGVAIELTLPEEPAIVRGDRDELIEVLENLIENSLKYGASGERVEIGLAWADLDRPQAEPRPPGRRCARPGPDRRFLHRSALRLDRCRSLSARTPTSRPRSLNRAVLPPASSASAKASARTPSTSRTLRARSAKRKSRPAPKPA